MYSAEEGFMVSGQHQLAKRCILNYRKNPHNRYILSSHKSDQCNVAQFVALMEQLQQITDDRLQSRIAL